MNCYLVDDFKPPINHCFTNFFLMKWNDLGIIYLNIYNLFIRTNNFLYYVKIKKFIDFFVYLIPYMKWYSSQVL